MSTPASNTHLYLTAFIAIQTGTLFGYSVGFIGGVLVLPSFQHHFHLSNLAPSSLAAALSRIVLLWIVGAFFGVLLGIPVCQRYGRRWCLNLCAVLYVIGAGLQLARAEGGSGLVVFQIGRLLNGLGVGAGTLVTPMFISEIAKSSQRDMLMGAFQAVLQLAALVGFWAAFASHAILSESNIFQWQIPVGIQLLPGVLLLLGTFLIPETPRFRAEQGEWEDAEGALAWLRGLEKDDEEVQQELQDIREAVEASRRMELSEKRGFLEEVSRKGVRNRLGVGVGLMVAQNMVGLNALNYYSPVIFMSAGFTSVSSSLFLSGIFGIMKVVSSLCFMFYCANYRTNRFWLTFGSTICAISMLVLAFYVRLLPPPDKMHEGHLTAGGVISVLMVYIFTLAFGVSLGPISWSVCAEIFPLHINAKCCAITTCTQWLFMAIVASITPFLLASLGWITYLIYGIFCILTLAWVVLLVPETRGVPLGKPMDELFGSKAETETEEDSGQLETSTLLDNEHSRRRLSFVA